MQTRTPSVLVFAALLGCQQVSWLGATRTPPPPLAAAAASDCPEESVLTWDTWASGFFVTWCTPCHTSTYEGEMRQGAPEGVDFDTWEGVVAHLAGIEAWATGPNPPMPPAGGVTSEERALLAEYLACGAPGSGSAQACAVRTTTPGPVRLDGPEAVDALCAAGNTVEGDLFVEGGDLDLDCLCEVTGDVVLDAGDAVAVRAPSLDAIGGDLRVFGNADLAAIELDGLNTVAGTVEVVDNPALGALALGDLDVIGGDLWIEGQATLTALVLERLGNIDGTLTIAENPALATLELVRAESVGGDVIIRGNAALASLSGTSSLAFVGGSVEITDHDSLDGLGAFLFVEEVGGSVTISGNHGLGTFDGFTMLDVVPGDLRITDNPGLVQIAGFQLATAIDGELDLSGNLDLATVPGFTNLGTISGPLILTDNPVLLDFIGPDALLTVGGIAIRDNAAMTTVQALADVTTVNGDLDLSRNASLETVLTLRGVASVSGSFTIEDNPVLPTSQADGLVQDIGVENIGGTVTVSGNGPG